MARQQIHGLVDFCQAGAGDAVAQELLVAVVVARRIEQEQPVLHHLRAQLGPQLGRLVGPADAQAGEDARQLLHVRLRIAAFHAQRVQLHQLARVVLVDLAGRVLRIVQVQQHGRRADGRGQQVAELAERVRPDGAVFIAADEGAHVALGGVDVEVVHPEPGHLLLQLVGRVQRAPDRAVGRGVGAVAGDHARVPLRLDPGVGRLVLGVLAQPALFGLRILVRLPRDRQGVDAPLDLGRQGGAGGGVQLGLEIALRPQFADAGQLGRRGAPGDAVDQRGLARRVRRRRLGQRGGRQRQQQEGGKTRQNAAVQDGHGRTPGKGRAIKHMTRSSPGHSRFAAT